MKIRSYIKDKFVDFILWFLMILIIELFLIMFKVVNSLIIVVSITLMLGVELLIKNIELKQERMKHKEFEKIKEKKKNPQVLKIKY